MSAKRSCTLAIVLIMWAAPSLATAQPYAVGTAFTYQGRLLDGGLPAGGDYDFEFTLFDDPAAGSLVGGPVEFDDEWVDYGLFTVGLNFGEDVFKTDARWLRIGVRPYDSTGAYTYLDPRQEVTPVPYALALPGLWTQQNATSPNLIGGNSGNSVNTGVYGATISGGGPGNRVTDHYGIIGGGSNNVAGDDDADPANVQGTTIAGGRQNDALGTSSTIAGGYDNTASGTDSTVGGGSYNTAGSDNTTVAGGASNEAIATSATVSGGYDNTAGGTDSTVGGGSYNQALAGYATIAGGGRSNPADPATNNRVTDNYGTIGGGGNNQAGDNDGDPSTAEYATVAGGRQNTANGVFASVGGGFFNEAAGYGVVAGGAYNEATGTGAFVGAGAENTASGLEAMIPGGEYNSAVGERSFAAGHRAKALHNGAFVWADNTDEDFESTGGNQFLIRALGGVGIGTNTPSQKLHVAGDILGSGPDGYDEPGDEARLFLGDTNHCLKAVYGSGVRLGTFAAPDGICIEQLTGEVGIGTSTPGAKLHVTGIPGVDGIMFPDGTLQTTAGGGGGGEIGGSGTIGYLAKFTATNAIGDSVIYEGGGNIGIGTTTLGAKLDVAGTVNVDTSVLGGAGPPWASLTARNSEAAAYDNAAVLGMRSVASNLLTSTDFVFYRAGVWGDAGSASEVGVRGTCDAGSGVEGVTDTGYALYGAVRNAGGGATGKAGYFDGPVDVYGDVEITGTAIGGVGSPDGVLHACNIDTTGDTNAAILGRRSSWSALSQTTLRRSGVWGDAGGAQEHGVLGTSDTWCGVIGLTQHGTGVCGEVAPGGTGLAGEFHGNVDMTGDLDVTGVGDAVHAVAGGAGRAGFFEGPVEMEAAKVGTLGAPGATLYAENSETTEKVNAAVLGKRIAFSDVALSFWHARSGVWGDARDVDDTGVLGTCDGGEGVHGVTDTGTAVKGTVQNAGGGGTGKGVHGESISGHGVYGESISGHVVSGKSSSGPGVFGESDYGFGVSGHTLSSSTDEWAPAVYGHNEGAGDGVLGRSENRHGVYGVTYSTESGDAGVYAKNTGPGSALHSEGDLFVTGAFKGTLGPNSGAPFPRPAYDSGWVYVTGGNYPLTHNVGGDIDDYVVDLQFKNSGIIDTYRHGGDKYWDPSSEEYRTSGMYWWMETNSTINVVAHSVHQYARVRIWVCPSGSKGADAATAPTGGRVAQERTRHEQGSLRETVDRQGAEIASYREQIADLSARLMAIEALVATSQTGGAR